MCRRKRTLPETGWWDSTAKVSRYPVTARNANLTYNASSAELECLTPAKSRSRKCAAGAPDFALISAKPVLDSFTSANHRSRLCGRLSEVLVAFRQPSHATSCLHQLGSNFRTVLVARPQDHPCRQGTVDSKSHDSSHQLIAAILNW
jgi:hypothetical protein